MSKYSKRAWLRNHHPDLFDWHRERELRRASPAARRIAKQFGLPLYHAITIATLAGIGPKVTR
jgi:hypothetical protein